MCGFIAVFNKDRLALETIKYKNALNYLNHRGPDFQDIFVNSKNTLFQGFLNKECIYLLSLLC